MTVREVIEKLQQFDQDHEVLATCVDEMEAYVTDIRQMGPKTVKIDAADGAEYNGQDDPDEDDDEFEWGSGDPTDPDHPVNNLPSTVASHPTAD